MVVNRRFPLKFVSLRLFFFLTLDLPPKKSFAFDRLKNGITAMRFEIAQAHFISDNFAAVAAVVTCFLFVCLFVLFCFFFVFFCKVVLWLSLS